MWLRWEVPEKPYHRLIPALLVKLGRQKCVKAVGGYLNMKSQDILIKSFSALIMSVCVLSLSPKN